ncbi:MAG: CPBP family intramembrane metalloprotease [Chryseobacterium sp.]|uniref:CPBP family intramembrane glutamic endopeptidase n=1 Tax=Chryseobacterium sp. TaxID=1871047 RepID=UPI0025BEA007|nr:type II CAAX endopeptidase family protein [Chryseobacterium sp.]MCJ7936334.1 CPBP family intramembrane metalloprotease [Chryseobacterium sp.]
MFSRFNEGIKKTVADHFPLKIKIELKDIFAILLIPMIFLNSYIISFITGDRIELAFADSMFRGFLFFLICLIYGKMLRAHWRKFNAAKWQSWLLVIAGAILIQVVIHLTRSLLPLEHTPVEEAKDDIDITKPGFMILFIAMGPIFTALIEDIIFRYTLLSKLFIPNRVWRIILVILNAVGFGLIHYNNFGGSILATVSFMSAGLFLNLIYIYTRNIWHVLLIHALNNFVLSVLGLIVGWILAGFIK